MTENPYLSPDYCSNDWLVPIGERAKAILTRFPREDAINIASAVLMSVDVGDKTLPWCTVFKSDSIDKVLPKLVQVLKTPDFRTPVFNPEYRMAIDEVLGILEAGKKKEHFTIYHDQARKFPQYAEDWIENLERQFGIETFLKAKEINPELFRLLTQSKLIARLNRNSIRQEGESVEELINRVMDFFEISFESEEKFVPSLIEANRILQQGLEGYRKAAYQLRGLEAPAI